MTWSQKLQSTMHTETIYFSSSSNIFLSGWQKSLCSNGPHRKSGRGRRYLQYQRVIHNKPFKLCKLTVHKPLSLWPRILTFLGQYKKWTETDTERTFHVYDQTLQLPLIYNAMQLQSLCCIKTLSFLTNILTNVLQITKNVKYGMVYIISN